MDKKREKRGQVRLTGGESGKGRNKAIKMEVGIKICI